ncbi:hypothetical protein M422DRAFT_275118 [Sphaerobolus stellatus SS14]|uniref:Myb-like domain-containing protein n=1 Tax=Sphaerobolus stellatus (strain SS14) TaxID=990650 RepID=A0A0C9UFZ8_SPHS4|nr:hypothetical protein M422DRAFT_275118 [Sphaerobolus stellatus SS14]
MANATHSHTTTAILLNTLLTSNLNIFSPDILCIMPTTRAQAATIMTNEPPKSPIWQCEDGALPSEDSGDSDFREPFQRSRSSSVDSHEGSEHLGFVQPESRQSKNARNPQPRNVLQAAWDELARQMAIDSCKLGPVSEIKRTGSACRSRFNKILEAHRRDETKSLQKTGTNEVVDEHIKNLTELVSLVDGHDTEKVQRSAKAKKKESIERTAALELRKAAMGRLVDSTGLMDISQLEGATIREKQGQRKRKHSSSPGDDESDKENMPIKRSRGQSVIEKVFNQRQKEDEKLLAEVREREEQRQGELMGGFDRLAGSIDALVSLSKTQMENSIEKQRQDSAKELKLLELLNTLAQPKQ